MSLKSANAPVTAATATLGQKRNKVPSKITLVYHVVSMVAAGIVRDTLNQKLDAGEVPTKAALREAGRADELRRMTRLRLGNKTARAA